MKKSSKIGYVNDNDTNNRYYNFIGENQFRYDSVMKIFLW